MKQSIFVVLGVGVLLGIMIGVAADQFERAVPQPLLIHSNSDGSITVPRNSGCVIIEQPDQQNNSGMNISADR